MYLILHKGTTITFPTKSVKTRPSEQLLLRVDLGKPIRFALGGFSRESHGHRHIDRGPIATHEVFLIEEGTLYLQADDRRTVANRGTVLIHPKGVMQKGFRTSFGPVKYLWFHFDAKIDMCDDMRLADDLLGSLETPRRLYGEGTPNARILIIPAKAQPRRWATLLHLGYLICENRTCFRHEKDGLIGSFLSMLSVDFLTSRDHGTYSASVTLADRVKDYIDHHVDNALQVRQLCIDQIATNYQLHPDYLNRLFKKETGLSIHAYIQQRRMVQACGLLAVGCSVAAVAQATGFGNPDYFAQAFKKAMRCTPTEYRSRVRSN